MRFGLRLEVLADVAKAIDDAQAGGAQTGKQRGHRPYEQGGRQLHDHGMEIGRASCRERVSVLV